MTDPRIVETADLIERAGFTIAEVARLRWLRWAVENNRVTDTPGRCWTDGGWHGAIDNEGASA